MRGGWCEGDAAIARDAIGLGEGDGLPCGARDAVLGEHARGGEAPGAIDQDTHAAADGIGVEDVGDLLFAGAEVLATLALDTGVGPGGAGESSGGEGFKQQHLHLRIGLGGGGEDGRGGRGADLAAGERDGAGGESGGREEFAAGGHAGLRGGTGGLRLGENVRP